MHKSTRGYRGQGAPLAKPFPSPEVSSLSRVVGIANGYSDGKSDEDYDGVGELDDVLNSWTWAVDRF